MPSLSFSLKRASSGQATGSATQSPTGQTGGQQDCLPSKGEESIRDKEKPGPGQWPDAAADVPVGSLSSEWG